MNIKKIAISALIGTSITGSLFCVEQLTIAIQTANASPGLNACTPQDPSPPFSNQVCTGYGTYCTYGMNCSIVYGEPGTWNPGGYAPPLAGH